MQATVEAAIISGCFGFLGVGGTVWVAIMSFRANRRISRDSAQADRDRALREKQWEVYEEILGILDDRQAYRLEIMTKARTAKADGTDFETIAPIATKYATAFHDPETRGTRGRLMAYASPEVRRTYLQMIADDTALGMSVVARTTTLFAQHLTLFVGGKSVSNVNLKPPVEPEVFWATFEELSKLVARRDNELTDLIRRELGSDPSPKPLPQVWRGVMAAPNPDEIGASIGH